MQSLEHYPCIEQPLRVTLHCNGYYLWGLPKGRVAARKRRSEKDEFRLSYGEGGVVTIQNHKFGTYLSVARDDKGVRQAVCAKDLILCNEEEEEAKETKGAEEDADALTVEEEVEFINKDEIFFAESTSTCRQSAKKDDDEEEDLQEKLTIIDESIEDRKWHFIKDANGSKKVMLQSLNTGENLGLDASGNLVLTSDSKQGDNTMLWGIECVTGELCFLSNPLLDQRIRCDLAGLTSLSPNWKGWEVFRFMEAGDGYVKISNWMHSQYTLCSTLEGAVSTCSHADSFLEDSPKGVCSKWAIEKSTDGNGVIIRSKTHDRLLGVKEGTLMTYCHENLNEKLMTNDNENEQTISEYGETSATKDNESINSNTQTLSSRSNTGNGDATETKPKPRNQWLNKNFKRMQASFTSRSNRSECGEAFANLQDESIVWQLEAAHLQTYYFSNAGDSGNPNSIGPFPLVTPNLRKTDKFQLVREGTLTKFFNSENKQYVACTSDGVITYVDDEQDRSTEWIMDKPQYQEGGNIFKSKLHNLYLSYKEIGKETIEEASEGEVDKISQTEQKEGRLKNLFNKKVEIISELVGSETIGEREVWKLAPCMPRAVSSEKIKTFAIGTSIAVGTTIAMPFALAGVGALLGAVGAEVGIVANAIAVGLAGAEATASMGVIGVTAFIVFRPDENSLTDDHKNEEETETAWCKRPFSNWRGW